jgi:NADH-quinone oxidoreductase subunit C
MDAILETAVKTLQEQFGAGLHEYQGQVQLIIGSDRLSEVCRYLKEEQQFDMLAEETAVDYWPQETPRFHVVYKLYSFEKNVILGLRVPLDGNAPHLESLTSIYPNANWHEREIWDMFGIHFDNHPDLRRILMPADWQGHPLRKDYPLGYEEVQFTFNTQDILKRKPQARE